MKNPLPAVRNNQVGDTVILNHVQVRTLVISKDLSRSDLVTSKHKFNVIDNMSAISSRQRDAGKFTPAIRYWNFNLLGTLR
jgi:hypothetical protein